MESQKAYWWFFALPSLLVAAAGFAMALASGYGVEAAVVAGVLAATYLVFLAGFAVVLLPAAAVLETLSSVIRKIRKGSARA